MLLPQGGEAVVSGDEQVVAGDPGLVVEGRPVRFHLRSKRFPEQLLFMGERTPGLQRSLMNGHHCELALSAGERRRDSLAEEALTATVIRSDTSGRAEGIIDKYIRAKPGHKL